MPLPKRPFLKIYDPRQGDDYQVEVIGEKRLSMLEHQFLVVGYYPGRKASKVIKPDSLEFDELNRLIKASLLRLGKIGFFAISPLTKELKESQLVHLSKNDEMLGSLIGYFDLDGPTINSHLDLRHRMASYAEWIIGCCNEPFKRPADLPRWYQEVIYWDMDYLFTQIENIGSLSLFNGETGELLFFTRIFNGIDVLLEPLKKSNRVG